MPQPVCDIIWQNSNISHPGMKRKRKAGISLRITSDLERFSSKLADDMTEKAKTSIRGSLQRYLCPWGREFKLSNVRKEEEKRWSSKLKSWLISHLYSHTQCHNWKPASTRWWPNNCWPVEQLGAKCLAQGYPQGQFSKSPARWFQPAQHFNLLP